MFVILNNQLFPDETFTVESENPLCIRFHFPMTPGSEIWATRYEVAIKMDINHTHKIWKKLVPVHKTNRGTGLVYLFKEEHNV